MLAPAPASPVIELRQYELLPGQRDTLIALFESHFVSGQEDDGMRLHGEFRDARNPERFVWLRGFPDVASRARRLESFYAGPVWKAHREAANATMVDVGNVLLLESVDKRGFSLAGRMAGLVVATIYLLHSPVDADFTRFFAERVRPVMTATGAAPVAQLRTLYAPNDFPRLPLREGEHAFVWFAAFASAGEYERHLAKLRDSPAWRTSESELASRLKSPALRLELEPTQRCLARNAGE